jgi:hypothetical protein
LCNNRKQRNTWQYSFVFYCYITVAYTLYYSTYFCNTLYIKNGVAATIYLTRNLSVYFSLLFYVFGEAFQHFTHYHQGFGHFVSNVAFVRFEELLDLLKRIEDQYTERIWRELREFYHTSEFVTLHSATFCKRWCLRQLHVTIFI